MTAVGMILDTMLVTEGNFAVSRSPLSRLTLLTCSRRNPVDPGPGAVVYALDPKPGLTTLLLQSSRRLFNGEKVLRTSYREDYPKGIIKRGCS